MVNSEVFSSSLFAESYNLYFEQIKKFLFSIVPCPFARDEIVQDVFIHVFEKKLEVHPGTAKTRNFLITIAKNKALDYVRREKIKLSKMTDVPVEEVTMGDNFYKSLDDSYIEGEVLFTLRDTISRFPEDEKEIISAFVYEDSSIEEIRRKSGENRYKIKKIRDNAKDEIRKKLSGYF